MEVIDNEALIEKIGIVSRQTDYDNETIRQKLIDTNYDHLKIIKEYMGLDNQNKPTSIKGQSINQEIYKQIRKKLDVKEYNKKQAEKLKTEIDNNQLILENKIKNN
jgi:hypothetical protein